MGLSMETWRQIEIALQPMALRQRNMIARAQVLLVDDSQQLQSLQVAVPETVPDGEHYQPYGVSSVPLAGAEGVALFPSGDRGHPLIVVASDRRYRPTGGQPGEVTLYTDEGDTIRLARGHAIVFATSGHILQGSAGAAQQALLGNQFLSALGTLVTAIATAVGTSGSPAGATAAGTAITAALTTFQGAAASYLSAKVKLE